VGVSIDILDEDHSLRLAVRRLATDAGLRATLGSGAYAMWSENFRLEGMVDGYVRAIGAALAAPLPDSADLAVFPEHLRSVGYEYAQRVLQNAGLSVDVPDLWTAKHD
jgi:hypothetical protein